jgi:hypothetical protein
LEFERGCSPKTDQVSVVEFLLVLYSFIIYGCAVAAAQIRNPEFAVSILDYRVILGNPAVALDANCIVGPSSYRYSAILKLDSAKSLAWLAYNDSRC